MFSKCVLCDVHYIIFTTRQIHQRIEDTREEPEANTSENHMKTDNGVKSLDLANKFSVLKETLEKTGLPDLRNALYSRQKAET